VPLAVYGCSRRYKLHCRSAPTRYICWLRGTYHNPYPSSALYSTLDPTPQASPAAHLPSILLYSSPSTTMAQPLEDAYITVSYMHLV
jgi:hypothetical protein